MSIELAVVDNRYEVTINKLDSVIKRLPTRIISDGSELLRSTLVKNTPVRTGRLRDSITKDVTGGRGIIRTNTSYGLYVERGTRYFTGRFYGRRTIGEVIPKLNDLMLRFFRTEMS